MYCSEVKQLFESAENFDQKVEAAKLLIDCVDNMRFYDEVFHTVILQLVIADFRRRGINLLELVTSILGLTSEQKARLEFKLRDLIQCLINYVKSNPRSELAKEVTAGIVSEMELEDRLCIIMAESVARHLTHIENIIEARQSYRSTAPTLQELAKLVPTLFTPRMRIRSMRRGRRGASV